MKSPERLLWSEGMLLSPQHLQALDRFHEANVAARLAAVAPIDWGVLEIELDSAALAAGQVRLLRFAGVFPGGLAIAFEDAEGGPAPREVGASFAASARALDVHLAVPRERVGVPSCCEDGAPSPSRYVAGTRSIPDANAPDAKVPVRFARPNVVVLLGDERRDDYEAMKIAELTRTSSGQLTPAERYVPPCLRIGASPWLVNGVREVAARAVAKMRELHETRRHREGATEITAPDVVRLLQLLVLDGHVPVLAHVADAGDASPRECYLELARLAGALGTFQSEDPTTLPSLHHGDLRSTFEPLFARLGILLGGLALQRYVQVPLEQRAGGLFLARQLEERVIRGQMFLTVQCEHPEETVIEKLPRLCKIAAASEIQGLVQSQTPGLPLRVVHRPPPQLPVRPGVVHFQLVAGEQFWQGIVTGRNVAIYLPPPFDPARTKLELLAIVAEESSHGGAQLM